MHQLSSHTGKTLKFCFIIWYKRAQIHMYVSKCIKTKLRMVHNFSFFYSLWNNLKFFCHCAQSWSFFPELLLIISNPFCQASDNSDNWINLQVASRKSASKRDQNVLPIEKNVKKKFRNSKKTKFVSKCINFLLLSEDKSALKRNCCFGKKFFFSFSKFDRE